MQERRGLWKRDRLLGVGLHTWVSAEPEPEHVTVSVTVPERHAFGLAESLRAAGLSVSIAPALPEPDAGSVCDAATGRTELHVTGRVPLGVPLPILEPDADTRADAIAKRNSGRAARNRRRR